MGAGIRVRPDVTVGADELRWRFSRASGPGGQGVNTTDSRVELYFDVAGSGAFSETQRERVLAALEGRLTDGVLRIAASEHRSQRQNRESARERLGALLREALAPPPPPRRATRPSRGALRRRAASNKQRAETKKLRRPPSD
ncbi:alternative ribosome rescue aminoacyl-tRNA hydrolase ArfB [Georgenia wangjunii]|uniref:alternative ribosome rescue aminoacyl-tRNA hydrolase ArfB n=1 Tax=Georgenia wangjunii TaxID=3117730 RepID=UPI002F266EF2